MKMTTHGLLSIAASCAVLTWTSIASAQFYTAVNGNGMVGDGQTSVVYDAATGEVSVDAPAGVALTSINIASEAAIFTGDAAMNLGGDFDIDLDENIFKATFGSDFGSLSFGNVAQTGLAEDFLLSDLSVDGSLAAGGGLGDVDLVYVPEPAGLALIVLGVTCWLGACRRRRV
jgi:hypothetical protein